jgi:hypothetical protein
VSNFGFAQILNTFDFSNTISLDFSQENIANQSIIGVDLACNIDHNQQVRLSRIGRDEIDSCYVKIQLNSKKIPTQQWSR